MEFCIDSMGIIVPGFDSVDEAISFAKHSMFRDYDIRLYKNGEALRSYYNSEEGCRWSISEARNYETLVVEFIDNAMRWGDVMANHIHSFKIKKTGVLKICILPMYQDIYGKDFIEVYPNGPISNLQGDDDYSAMELVGGHNFIHFGFNVNYGE